MGSVQCLIQAAVDLQSLNQSAHFGKTAVVDCSTIVVDDASSIIILNCTWIVVVGGDCIMILERIVIVVCRCV